MMIVFFWLAVFATLAAAVLMFADFSGVVWNRLPGWLKEDLDLYTASASITSLASWIIWGVHSY
jgi:hypothetical protein